MSTVSFTNQLAFSFSCVTPINCLLFLLTVFLGGMGGAVTSCRGDSTSSVGEKSTEELILCSGGDGVRFSVEGDNRAA